MKIPVLGVSVRAAKDVQEASVLGLAEQTSTKLGVEGLVHSSDITVSSDYVGEGYGIPTPEGMEAIKVFAELEGILLDPVYSAKAAAGMIDLIKKGHFNNKHSIVFLHTGGSTSLFGYMPSFDTQNI